MGVAQKATKGSAFTKEEMESVSNKILALIQSQTDKKSQVTMAEDESAVE
jgi:hypothetical protein